MIRVKFDKFDPDVKFFGTIDSVQGLAYDKTLFYGKLSNI